MRSDAGNRRLVVAVALAAWIVVTLVALAAAVYAVQYRRAADYPGSVMVSDHTLSDLLPRPHIRRDTSYRTADEFPIVYHWYSSGFDLGPEMRAQSGCILMGRTRPWLIFENDMSVTICDTSRGRLIFVTRAVSLR